MCNVEGPPLRQSRPGPMSTGEPLPVYLDYNATTPIGEPALAALTYHASRVYGNPSSAHPYGLESKYCVEKARSTIRRVLGIPEPEFDPDSEEPPEVIFTSGGTESNNLAIFGTIHGIKRREEEHAAAAAGGDQKGWTTRSIISTNFEHPAVEKVLQTLEKESHYKCNVYRCPVNKNGRISSAELRTFLLEDCVAQRGLVLSEVALFTMVWCNGEIGTVLPIADLVKVAKELCPQCYFHTDGAQGFGKVPLPGSSEEKGAPSDPRLPLGGVDMLSICGHKFYAPKGSGALYVRKEVPLVNISFGADHERGKRPGTENILFNTALAAALEYAVLNQPQLAAHMGHCRNVLYSTMQPILVREGFALRINGDTELLAGVESCPTGSSGSSSTIPSAAEIERIHASTETTMPNTLNFSIRQLINKDTGLKDTYISAARLIEELGHIVAMSAGSACHSTVKKGEPVHISGTLLAIGCTEEQAIGTLRLSCGKNTTPQEMTRAGRFVARRSLQQVADW